MGVTFQYCFLTCWLLYEHYSRNSWKSNDDVFIFLLSNIHLSNNFGFVHCRISGKILQLETVTQSEAMRRRYRYLSHFSLTTTFQVSFLSCWLPNILCILCLLLYWSLRPYFQLCEIDLSEMLPPDALFPFMDEIKKREKQRKQLAKKVRSLSCIIFCMVSVNNILENGLGIFCAATSYYNWYVYYMLVMLALFLVCFPISSYVKMLYEFPLLFRVICYYSFLGTEGECQGWSSCCCTICDQFI